MFAARDARLTHPINACSVFATLMSDAPATTLVTMPNLMQIAHCTWCVLMAEEVHPAG